MAVLNPVTAIPLEKGKLGHRDADTERAAPYKHIQTQGEGHCGRD